MNGQYCLDNSFTNRDWAVYVVGCGGTGSFVAEGLAHILNKKVKIVLVDHDRVEERNIIRQNFYPSEIDEVKSVALARRLSQRYERPIAYSTFPIELTNLKYSGLLLGCVDNGIARKHIAGRADRLAWWIDAGNGLNFGQILIGNHKDARFYTQEQKVSRLPLPSIQRPEILMQAPIQPGCADIPDQGPTINRFMAVMMIEVTRRVIEGICPWIQILIDLEHGTIVSVMATPAIVEEILHTKSKSRVEIVETEE